MSVRNLLHLRNVARGDYGYPSPFHVAGSMASGEIRRAVYDQDTFEADGNQSGFCPYPCRNESVGIVVAEG